jgi:hypothetical protein
MRSGMIQLLLLGALSLFLSACVTSPAKDASQESDLDVLVLGVQTMTEPRGNDLKNPEDVRDTEEAWNLLLDLDDIKWLSNRDKAGIRGFVEKAVERIKISRRTCSGFDRLFNLRECK